MNPDAFAAASAAVKAPPVASGHAEARCSNRGELVDAAGGEYDQFIQSKTKRMEDAASHAWSDDLQQDALALLATVRHLMSGREIAVCEAAADIEQSDGVDAALLASLKIQFSREISRWKDGVAA